MSNSTFLVIVVAFIGIFGVVVPAVYGLLDAAAPSPVLPGTGMTAEATTTAAPAPPTMPAVATRKAANVTSSTAILRGMIDSRGVPVRYWFEYGPDPLLNAILIRTTPRVPLDARAEETPVETDIFDLAPHTTYYFRVVADTDAGVTRGEHASFRTE